MNLITTKDVATLLRVKEITVRHYINRKAIPFIRLNGIIRFDSTQIEKWIQSHSIQETV